MNKCKFVIMGLFLLNSSFIFSMKSFESKQKKVEKFNMGSLNVFPKEIQSLIFDFVVNPPHKKIVLSENSLIGQIFYIYSVFTNTQKYVNGLMVPRLVCKGFKKELGEKLKIQIMLGNALARIFDTTERIILCQSDLQELKGPKYDVLKTVKKLIESNSCLDLSGEFIEEFIDWAFYFGHKDMAKILIQKLNNLDFQDKSGRTLLMRFCGAKHTEIAHLLIDLGVKLDFQENTWGATALIMASKNHALETIGLLIKKGANLDLQDKDGKTALMWACYRVYVAVIKLLINFGANPTLKDVKGQLALDLFKYQDQETKKILIRAMDIWSLKNGGELYSFKRNNN